MRLKSYVKIITLSVLVAFVVSFVMPTQAIALEKSLKNLKEAKANVKFEKAKINTALGSLAAKMDSVDVKLQEDVEKKDIDKFKKDLKNTKDSLKDLKDTVEKELANNDSKLSKTGAKVAQGRNRSFRSEVESRISTLEAMVEDMSGISNFTTDINGKNLEGLAAKLIEIKNLLNPQQPDTALGNTLPHNNVSEKPAEPATGAGIVPAYMSTQTTASGSTVLPKTPTQADYDNVNETKPSQEIKNLADSLQTPIKIYEYVRNNVDFEPYYGLRKGAEGTLNQMGGNDYDQAALLISMLRYKGIPARYVKGTIEIPIDQVIGWTGAETPEAAVRILGSLGVPTVSVVSGGSITAVRTEHVWVEAYVPYENYRGAGEMKGQSIWVPMDASFKQYTKIQGLDFQSITGLSKDQLIAASKSNGEASADGLTLTKVDISSMTTLMDGAIQKFQDYIKNNNLENKDLKDIIGGKRITSLNLGLLSSTLPYKTVTVTSELNSMDDTSYEKIGFKIRGNDPFNLNFSGDYDFNVQFKAFELYGKRITLSWVPASQEDADVINSYGGIEKTPAYLIQVKPQLKVDGVVSAEGAPVGLGYQQEFTITMGHVGSQPEDVVNPVIAGGYYSVGLDYGKIDSRELQTVRDRLYALKDTISEKDVNNDNVMGDILNVASKAYFAQLDAFDSIIATASKVSSVRLLSEAMTGFKPNVKYMFSVPVEVSGGSFFIDVDHDVVGVNSYEGKKENEISYMMISGILGSAMEHGIYEQIIQMPSVSTIKILEEANKRGVPIYNFNKDNIDRINEIHVSNSVRTDIVNAVNSGKIVVIPKEEIRYFDWVGSGYIIMDPNTGAAGYMISGGTAGGSLAMDISISLMGIISVIWAIYDAVSIAMAFIAATNPIVAAIFFILYAFSLINVVMTLNDIIMYWESGDYKYASKLMEGLLINLATFGLGKILEAILPGISALFKSVSNKMDDMARYVEEMGDDVVEDISRIDGPGRLPDAEAIVKDLKDIGVDESIIQKVADTEGLKGLDSLQDLINTGKATEEQITDMLSKGYSIEDASQLINKGINYADFAKYGIKNSTEAETVLDLVNRGYRLDDIAKLVDFGYTPSGMISRGLNTIEAMQNAAQKIGEVFQQMSTKLDELFDLVDETADAGDDIIFTSGGIKTYMNKAILKLKGITDDALYFCITGCFTGETLVLTDSGLKRIDSIKAGDKVYSTDTPTNQSAYKKVLEVQVRNTDEFIKLKVNGELINTTPRHLFYTTEGTWKAAENLKIGDKLIDSTGAIRNVTAADRYIADKPQKIYNLTIEDYHTYYVSNLRVLVHNLGCPSIKTVMENAVEKSGMTFDELSTFRGALTGPELNLSRTMVRELYQGVKDSKFALSKVDDVIRNGDELLKNATHQIDVLDSTGKATTTVFLDDTGKTVRMKWTVGSGGTRGTGYERAIVPDGMQKGHIKSVLEGALDNAVEDSPLNIIAQSSQVNQSKIRYFEDFRVNECQGMEVITDILDNGYERVRIPAKGIDVTFNPLSTTPISDWGTEWYKEFGGVFD